MMWRLLLYNMPLINLPMALLFRPNTVAHINEDVTEITRNETESTKAAYTVRVMISVE